MELEKAHCREIVLQEELGQLNEQHEQLEQQIEESSLLVKEKEFLKKNVQDELTTIKVGFAQREEKKGGLNSSLNKLRTDLRETQEQIEHLSHEIQNCGQKKTGCGGRN